jgi:hypothetical protein
VYICLMMASHKPKHVARYHRKSINPLYTFNVNEILKCCCVVMDKQTINGRYVYCKNCTFVRLETIMVVIVQSTVLWVLMPCGSESKVLP